MKSWASILFVLMVLSCGSEEVLGRPKVFIEREEMIDLIVDVQILESHYHNIYQRDNVYANALDSATQFIFEDHKVTKNIFNENLLFYAHELDTLFLIYESALDTINNRINSNIQQ